MKKFYNLFKNERLLFAHCLLAIAIFAICFFPKIHLGYFFAFLLVFIAYHASIKIGRLQNRQQQLTYFVKTILENCPDMVFVKDLNSRYIFGNKSLLNFLKLESEEDFINKTDFDFFPDYIARERIKKDEVLKQTGNSYVYDMVSYLDNKKYILEVTKMPLLDEKQQICAILGIIRDVTLIRSANEKLEQEQKLLHTIIDNVPFVAYLRDLHANIIYKNKLCEMIFDPSRHANLEQAFLDFCNTHLKYINNSDMQVFETRSPVNFQINFVVDDKECFFEVHKIPIFNADNLIDKFLIVAKDITMEKNIESQKETFVATLTHDLKTPTLAQKKAIEKILNNENTALNKEDKEILSEVYNSCNYMHKMLNNLISTYKYSNGNKMLVYEKFDLVSLLYECCKEMKYLIEDNSNHIKFDFEAQECLLCADKLEIKRVLVNLLSNAVHHSCKGSTVRIMIEDSEDSVSFTMSNPSRDLPKEDINTCFDLFTLSSREKQTGSGIGLYLSKQIIEAHEGDMFAEKVDYQCSFGFTLYKAKMSKSTQKIELDSQL